MLPVRRDSRSRLSEYDRGEGSQHSDRPGSQSSSRPSSRPTSRPPSRRNSRDLGVFEGGFADPYRYVDDRETRGYYNSRPDSRSSSRRSSRDLGVFEEGIIDPSIRSLGENRYVDDRDMETRSNYSGRDDRLAESRNSYRRPRGDDELDIALARDPMLRSSPTHSQRQSRRDLEGLETRSNYSSRGNSSRDPRDPRAYPEDVDPRLRRGPDSRRDLDDRLSRRSRDASRDNLYADTSHRLRGLSPQSSARYEKEYMELMELRLVDQAKPSDSYNSTSVEMDRAEKERREMQRLEERFETHSNYSNRSSRSARPGRDGSSQALPFEDGGGAPYRRSSSRDRAGELLRRDSSFNASTTGRPVSGGSARHSRDNLGMFHDELDAALLRDPMLRNSPTLSQRQSRREIAMDVLETRSNYSNYSGRNSGRASRDNLSSFVDTDPRLRRVPDSPRDLDDRADTRSNMSGRTRGSREGVAAYFERESRSVGEATDVPRVVDLARKRKLFREMADQRIDYEMNIKRKQRNINYLIDLSISLSIVVIIASLYVVLAEWGPVSREELIIPSLVSILIGLSILLCSIIGLQATRFSTPWMLFTYAGAQVVSFTLEMWVCSALGASNAALREVQSQLPSASLALAPAETFISRMFNAKFFADAIGCTTYNEPLWSFVASFCPVEMERQLCRGCFVYSANQCIADRVTCYANNSQLSMTCPYMACRAGLLNYAMPLLSVVEYCAYSFMILQRILCIAVFVYLYILFNLVLKREEQLRNATESNDVVEHPSRGDYQTSEQSPSQQQQQQQPQQGENRL